MSNGRDDDDDDDDDDKKRKAIASKCSIATVLIGVSRLIDDLLEKASTWLCFVLLLLLLLLVSAKCQEKQKLISSIYLN